jgi:epoxyqueuosine reductase
VRRRLTGLGKQVHHHFVELTARTGFVHWLMKPSSARFFAHVPPLPHWLTDRMGSEPPLGPRSLAIPDLPAELRTAPGIPRDAAAEDTAFEERPLQRWTQVHAEATEFILRHSWFSRMINLPGKMRYARLVAKPVRWARPVEPAEGVDGAELTRRLKESAARLGMSAIGVAPHDPKYFFGPYLGDGDGGRVIVCMLEQNWEATQTIPSLRAERAHNNTYERLITMADRLADELRKLGYSARPGDPDGRAMYIHFAVEAGLGQLGLNGQLLTPFAGSRCRITIITTDAPLILDAPVDFGVPAVCDRCQACVRRCPTGAITNRRAHHRGVYKAKIKMNRCLPMVAQVGGCAVCMKVCPVQRYGLPTVIDHYRETGKILGSRTDELEGYIWPIDGRYYGPGEKPRSAVSPGMLRPPDLVFDYRREVPKGPTTEDITRTTY